jgi:hypothetical protein
VTAQPMYVKMLRIDVEILLVSMCHFTAECCAGVFSCPPLWFILKHFTVLYIHVGI